MDTNNVRKDKANCFSSSISVMTFGGFGDGYVQKLYPTLKKKRNKILHKAPHLFQIPILTGLKFIKFCKLWCAVFFMYLQGCFNNEAYKMKNVKR